MVFSSCGEILSACVGGLVLSVTSLAWSLKQEIKIRQLTTALRGE